MTRAQAGVTHTPPRSRVLLTAAAILLTASSHRSAAQGAVAAEPKAEPYLQNVVDGYVDWGRGIVGAWGRAVDRTGNPPDRENPALARAGEILGRRRMLEIIQKVRATAETRVGDRPDFVERMTGFVRGAQVVKQRSGRGHSYDVLLEAPLWGVEGVAFEIYGVMSPARAAAAGPASDGGPPAPPGASPADPAATPDAPTGIVIDARGTGLAPALFPRVVDDSGAVLSSPDTVDIQALRDMGMAAYETVPSSVSSFRDRIGDRPLWVKASFAPGGPTSAPPAPPPPQSDAVAPRRGPRPYRIKAGGAAGSLKADIVLGRADADRLEAAGGKNLLKDCRVVVLVDSPVGGVEGVQGPRLRRWPREG
ncbi:MAG TPA: hypothetical protein VE404_07155 [Verrucomicrobiae bacterium]|nr:hypothetical protein [Verrucomicrobiae bacterium]